MWTTKCIFFLSSKMKKNKNQDEKVEFQKHFFRKNLFQEKPFFKKKNFFLCWKPNEKCFCFRFQKEKKCFWGKIFLCHIENRIHFFIQKEKKTCEKLFYSSRTEWKIKTGKKIMWKAEYIFVCLFFRRKKSSAVL